MSGKHQIHAVAHHPPLPEDELAKRQSSSTELTLVGPKCLTLLQSHGKEGKHCLAKATNRQH